jgi:hypothetical protein
MHPVLAQKCNYGVSKIGRGAGLQKLFHEKIVPLFLHWDEEIFIGIQVSSSASETFIGLPLFRLIFHYSVCRTEQVRDKYRPCSVQESNHRNMSRTCPALVRSCKKELVWYEMVSLWT